MSLRKAPFSLTHLLLLSTMAEFFCVPSTGDDASCLKGLKASIQDSGGRLSKWTTTDLAAPCSSLSTSNLDGIGCSSSRVVSIILNVSNLAGSISSSIADCSNLQTLDLSSNNLEGPVPTAVGNLSYLTRFNLSNNHLSGPIPVEISTCVFLNDIDLHDNELSGPIPGQLGILPRLRVFDVSDNRLTGAIPTSLSNTTTGGPRFNVSSFEGNKDLYGYPLLPPSSHGLTVLAIVGIGLGSGLLSLIVSFTAVCIWLRVSEQGYAAQEGKISQLMSEA